MSVQAQTITSPDQLRQTLSQATSGTTITLAEGNYGRLEWHGGQDVILQGPATFSGLDLRRAQGIRFDGVSFAYAFATGDAPHLRPFTVTDSRDITFENVSIIGDTGADGFPTAFGLAIADSTDITLTNSRIAGFLRGMVATRSSDLTITGNDIAGMRSDGLNFVQVRGVRITGNHIHNFNRDTTNGDHADMIQFWTRDTNTPSRDIVISGNVLNAGAGAWTQSIFMRNEVVDQGRAGAEMFYKNVSITGNVIINAHTHGITVGEVQGLTIIRNTVVQNAQAAGDTGSPSLWVPRIRVAGASGDVVITGNVVTEVLGFDGQERWHVADNLIVQNFAWDVAGYYGRVFGAQALDDPDNPASYRLPGADVGAPMLATP